MLNGTGNVSCGSWSSRALYGALAASLGAGLTALLPHVALLRAALTCKTMLRARRAPSLGTRTEINARPLWRSNTHTNASTRTHTHSHAPTPLSLTTTHLSTHIFNWYWRRENVFIIHI
ncbi:unnamed protein product [Leptidea sinapis]|uniref:Uncharacterized protein n=1 Tax=Leptidea sinapis TaxID=189913 RepID=A0A5E4QTK9_9NEOP|nr:unnamed protein product [Leptidea sinapis]